MMDHTKNSIAESLDLNENFLNFVTYTVMYEVLASPMHDSRSGTIAAIAKSFAKFWEDNTKIEKSITKEQKLIIEITAIENVKETVTKTIMLKDRHIKGIMETLKEQIQENKILYYASK